jgi:hypothetical protein
VTAGLPICATAGIIWDFEHGGFRGYLGIAAVTGASASVSCSPDSASRGIFVAVQLAKVLALQVGQGLFGEGAGEGFREVGLGIPPGASVSLFGVSEVRYQELHEFLSDLLGFQ